MFRSSHIRLRSLVLATVLLGSLATTTPPFAAPETRPATGGGTAARIHDGRRPVPGRTYLLVASPGSDRAPRVREDAYNASPDIVHPQVVASIENAARTVEDLVGLPAGSRPLTGATGGGLSGGLAYFLVHLDLATGGAVTGDLPGAATGRLGQRTGTGMVSVVQHVPAKVAAARAAGVAVVFVPVDHEAIDEPGTRLVATGAAARAGASRADGVLDVAEVRHVAEAVDYLCSAGSDGACDVAARMAEREAASTTLGADRRG